MTDHAFAALVVCAIIERQLDHCASVESRGTGSHVHFNVPVRASNARTSPLAAFVRLLSATDEPVTSSPFTIAGGEVSWYSAVSNGVLCRPRRRLSVPRSANAAHGRPFRASSAMIRA